MYKRSTIQIQNQDNLCCARAIVTAKAKVDQHPQYSTETIFVTDASVYSNQHVQYRTRLTSTVFDLLATKAFQFEQVLTQFQDLTYLYGAVKPLFLPDDLQFCSKMLKNSSDCLELYIVLFGCAMDIRGIFVYGHLNFTHDQMDHLMGLGRDMELNGIDTVH